MILPYKKVRPRQKGWAVIDINHCDLERPGKAGLKSLPSFMPPQCLHWAPGGIPAPGRAGNEHPELAFSITLLMSSSFPKLHALETANVKNGGFFPFLRKQPNPSPLMFAQPKSTSPLARQRRNAQMLCRPVKQETGPALPSLSPQYKPI